jgi:hypothetical protein
MSGSQFIASNGAGPDPGRIAPAAQPFSRGSPMEAWSSKAGDSHVPGRRVSRKKDAFLRRASQSTIRSKGLIDLRRLDRYADATGFPLEATSAADVTLNVETFNNEASHFFDRAARLLRETRYWVYDPASESFGPSKFVGLPEMSFDRYLRPLEGDSAGARFDGGVTHAAISNALGTSYQGDETCGHGWRPGAYRDSVAPPSVAPIDRSGGSSRCRW